MVSSSCFELSAIDGDGHDSLTLRGETAEALRFYSLSSAWMAAALLRWGAKAAEELGPEICCPGTLEYRLLRIAIPELATRLSLCPADLAAAREPYVVRSECLSTLHRIPLQHPSPSWNFLVRDVRRGNPMVIALDRTCPPEIDSDWAAAQIRAAWHGLGHHAFAWRPELLAAAA